MNFILKIICKYLIKKNGNYCMEFVINDKNYILSIEILEEPGKYYEAYKGNAKWKNGTDFRDDNQYHFIDSFYYCFNNINN